MAHEGVPLVIIQRQLGQHANLGVTSICLQGIDNSEIIDTIHTRRAPVIPATAGLHTTVPEFSPSGTTPNIPRRRTKRTPARKRSAPPMSSFPQAPRTYMHG